MRRDATDEQLERRLAGGYIVSLIIHALAAMLFFSVITSSSEQSSPEANEGAPALTVSHVAVVRRAVAAPPLVHPAHAHAPKIAPARAHPVIAGHPPVPTHRELSKQDKKAPPNPTPAPRAPFSPNPQQTAVAIASPAPAQIAAVPVNEPTALPVITQKISSTPQPTAAPPTAAPTAKPSAEPRPIATLKPVKAATAAPSAAPTTAPATPASLTSPGPTTAPRPSIQRGTSPTAGPKQISAPGPLPVKGTPRPARPIALPPTPTPQPTVRPTPTPRPAKTASPQKQKAYGDLLGRLRAGLPNGPVTPSTKRYTLDTKTIGRPGDPTPPPDVLAKTIFIYTSQAVKGVFKIFGGSEERVTMYVTSIKRHGAFATCTGWLVRFPTPSRGGRAAAANGPFHGGPVPVDNSGPVSENSYHPITEENATYECEASRLQPFIPSAAATPGP